MSENHFLKYFKFNKFLLNVCGVLQVESFGYISNVISIVVPYCCVGFLVLPFFYTFLFHDLDFETAMDIFCLLLEVMAGAFKGIIKLFACFACLRLPFVYHYLLLSTTFCLPETSICLQLPFAYKFCLLPTVY